MAAYFHVCLSLVGRRCLVVGGGKVAARKAASLAHAGAHVTVVSPSFSEEFSELDRVELLERHFQDSDPDGATLVVAATDDEELNRQIARAAQKHGALVNVVDAPDLCDFFVPASVVRGDLVVGISTSGKAPALAKRLRVELEDLLPPGYADFVDLLGELRLEVMAGVRDGSRRAEVFHQLASRRTWKLFTAEGPEAVRALARRLIAASR